VAKWNSGVSLNLTATHWQGGLGRRPSSNHMLSAPSVRWIRNISAGFAQEPILPGASAQLPAGRTSSDSVICKLGSLRTYLEVAKRQVTLLSLRFRNWLLPAPFPMLETAYECRYVKSLYTALWPHPASWRPMNQTDMAPEKDEAETLAALAERIEIFRRLT
jgi:hypothetical protein